MVLAETGASGRNREQKKAEIDCKTEVEGSSVDKWDRRSTRDRLERT